MLKGRGELDRNLGLGYGIILSERRNVRYSGPGIPAFGFGVSFISFAYFGVSLFISLLLGFRISRSNECLPYLPSEVMINNSDGWSLGVATWKLSCRRLRHFRTDPKHTSR